MADTAAQSSPCPYTILPVGDLAEGMTKTLNVWNVQEFFRIELLLRSEPVQMMYRIGAAGTESQIMLGLIYGFTWDVLQGSHHQYLRSPSGPAETIPGLSVMTFRQFAGMLKTLHEMCS